VPDHGDIVRLALPGVRRFALGAYAPFFD